MTVRRNGLLRLVLLEICDDPQLLLDAEGLADRLGVTPRTARNYRRWLLEEGYVVIVRGRRVEVVLTRKAREVLERYYGKLGEALG